jgi:poly(A) polymerase
MATRKLRTSREVYDQIRWDVRLSPSQFVVGYEARRPQPAEIAFLDFVPDGEIPWHRVLYFRDAIGLVWERQRRIDELVPPGRLSALVVPDAITSRVDPRPPPPRQAGGNGPEGPAGGGAAFTTLPVYRYDSARLDWVPASPQDPSAPPAGSSTLVVVTYNILAELGSSDDGRDEERLAALFAQLDRCNADVIGLQEVTHRSLQRLLDQAWIRASYVASERPGGPTVSPYGQVLLSRRPLRSLSMHAFSRDKRLLVGEVLAGGRPVEVAVTHLTSNRADDAVSKRARQLSTLIAYLERPAHPGPGAPGARAGRDAIVLGDLNCEQDELRSALGPAADRVTDAWPALRAGEPGYTFDPRSNPLAARSSLTGEPRRFDRVLLLSPAGRLTPRTIELVGDAPAGQGAAFASDHAGVRCELFLEETFDHGDLQQADPTYRSALVIIPPAELWPAIQAIRARHDRHFARWMPHITLLYGFVPDDRFDQAAAAIAEVVAGASPFTVSLDGLGLFEHRQGTTAWLRPSDEPAGSLRALQAALEEAFPRCDEQGKKSPSGFTPHLTVGQLPRGTTPGTPSRHALLGGAPWTPLAFTVGELVLISRRGDGPFEPRVAVPLGGGRPQRLGPTGAGGAAGATATGDQGRSARASLAASIEAACGRWMRAAGLPAEGPAIRWLGSHRLGVDDEQSDLDGLCVGPTSLQRAELFAALTAELQRAGLHDRARTVTSAVAPVLRLLALGTRVDITHAALPASTPLEGLRAASLGPLDEDSRRAVEGYLDSEALAALADAGGAPFRAGLRAVRRWARARAIYSNAFGYLGGVSWAIMFASCFHEATEAERADERALLARFFSTFAGWNHDTPIALPGAPGPRVRTDDAGRPPPMRVLTPGPRARNSARNVTRGTLAVLRSELERASKLACRRGGGRGTTTTPGSLFSPLDPLRSSPAALSVALETRTSGDLDACWGWLEGRALWLVLALEALPALATRPHAPAHPAPTATKASCAIGLSSALDATALSLQLSPVAGTLATAFADWTERPAGARLAISLADRGNTPPRALASRW